MVPHSDFPVNSHTFSVYFLRAPRVVVELSFHVERRARYCELLAPHRANRIGIRVSSVHLNAVCDVVFGVYVFGFFKRDLP